MAKSKRPASTLTIDDLQKGRVFRAKNPKMIGIFEPLVNDRQILYRSEFKQRIETIDHGYNEEFEAWCKEKGKLTWSESDQLDYELETKKDAKNIEVVMDYIIQYDSPTVKHGKNYPKVSATKFLKFAYEDVTDKMPEGEWAKEL